MENEEIKIIWLDGEKDKEELKSLFNNLIFGDD